MASRGERIVNWIVLDASITSAWVFPDESDSDADAILDAQLRRASDEAGVEILT